MHIGADAQWLIQPPRNLIANTQTVTLSDRPELRLDPTTLVSTGAIANVSGAQVYSIEAAATYGPLIVQGEYFWYNVDRTANTGVPLVGAPSLKFQGGYAQAGYVLTGESRTYNAAAAAYHGVKPAHPFSLDGGGWGRGRSRGVSRRLTSTISSQPRPVSQAGGRPSTRWRSTGTSTATSASCSTICTARCRDRLRRSRLPMSARSSTRSRCARSSRSDAHLFRERYDPLPEAHAARFGLLTTTGGGAQDSRS